MKTRVQQSNRIGRSHFTSILMLLLFGINSGVSPNAFAAILSWSGTSSTGANWNDSDNWGFAGTPANGDTLIFPGGVSRLTNTNNIANLTVAQIRFVGTSGNYNIYGNGFTLTNSFAATNNP